jgi:hypothetical protein
MGLFDKIFFPPKPANEFTLERYIRAIESGEFRDLFNLGVCETGGGTWLLKDFTQEPNALFVGAMGSGKSVSACYTLATWLMTNSDSTICFIADAVKGAADYSAMFSYDQVYPITGDGGKNVQVLIERVIDMVFSEAMARRELFSEYQAISIKDYEVKASLARNTEVKMARIVIMLEEFHSIPYQIFEFDKNFKKPHTIANKFHQLMRIGRSYGIFICAASQKSTKSDIPSEVVPNFTQKQIFKVSLGEANYVLGRGDPAHLTSAQKGRCYTEFGAVQFPYLTKESQAILLKRYVKPLNAECAYLSKGLIADYLDGKSTKELYRLKKLAELTEAMESFDGELVIQIIHERIGNEVLRLDSKTDNFGACMIITTPSGERKVIMYRSDPKIGVKTLNNLSNAMIHYKCSSALLYCLGENLPQSIYSNANDLGVKIFDHEDIKLISRQIDAGKVQNIGQLEMELANTSDAPTSLPQREIAHVRKKRVADSIELDLDDSTTPDDSDDDHDYIAADDLDFVLLGGDAAIRKGLKMSERKRRSVEPVAPFKKKKKLEPIE